MGIFVYLPSSGSGPTNPAVIIDQPNNNVGSVGNYNSTTSGNGNWNNGTANVSGDNNFGFQVGGSVTGDNNIFYGWLNIIEGNLNSVFGYFNRVLGNKMYNILFGTNNVSRGTKNIFLGRNIAGVANIDSATAIGDDLPVVANNTYNTNRLNFINYRGDLSGETFYNFRSGSQMEFFSGEIDLTIGSQLITWPLPAGTNLYAYEIKLIITVMNGGTAGGKFDYGNNANPTKILNNANILISNAGSIQITDVKTGWSLNNDPRIEITTGVTATQARGIFVISGYLTNIP